MADDTPGTTSNGMPAAASASASSPPRPKTNGSPPLSRTTRLALARLGDEQVVDLLLADSRAAFPSGLADEDALRLGWRQVDEASG